MVSYTLELAAGVGSKVSRGRVARNRGVILLRGSVRLLAQTFARVTNLG